MKVTKLGTFRVNPRQYVEFILTYRVTTREKTDLTRYYNYGQKEQNYDLKLTHVVYLPRDKGR